VFCDEFSHLSLHGPFECVVVTSTKTLWWHVWSAEKGCRTDRMYLCVPYDDLTFRTRDYYFPKCHSPIGLAIESHCVLCDARNNIYIYIYSLALQPAVGFGLSNNSSPFFPVYHQLFPSAHSQHLKISFYLLSKAKVISVYLVLFRLSSLNLSSLFLCSTFVTISFLMCGVVSPTPNP
jgi:hypothetical protein